MRSKKPKTLTPREYLDQHEQDLIEKHQRRLQAMTFQASRAATNNSSQKKGSFLWMNSRLVTAFTVVAIVTTVTTLIFLQDKKRSMNEKRVSTVFSTVPTTALPAWVMDTEIPDTLIENLDFYDWLAQHTEDQSIADKKYAILSIDKFYRNRFGKQFTTYNVTQRIPRTASYLGGIQE